MTLATRSRDLEIMDGDAFSSAELASNLRDLAFFARFTGAIDVIVREIGSLSADRPGGASLEILDVGAGGGDVAAGVAVWARRRGIRPSIVAADLSPRMITAARSNGSGATARLCIADARALPHPDGAFDIAYSSLVLHHLDESGIVAVLREMSRVTRLGFIVSDLRRSSVALAAVWALTRMTSRNRLTLNDGPLSVRRALTTAEIHALARNAGLPAANGAAGLNENRGGFRVRRDGPARLVLAFRHAPALRAVR